MSEVTPIITDEPLEPIAPDESQSNGAAGDSPPPINEPPRNAASSRRRMVYIVLVAVGVVTVVVIAVGQYVMKSRAVTVTKAEGPTVADGTSEITLTPEQSAAIVAEVVQKHAIQTDVTVPGKIVFNGNKVTPVLSQFSGRIVKLDATVESTVRAGQVLGTIDSPDIVGIQSDYQQALTVERSARTTFELAKRTRERAERLAVVEAIPQRELQQDQADESHAADDLKRAGSALAAARGRLQSAGMKEGEIERLASGARAVTRLLPIVVPISGTVIERKAGVGQVVQAGAGDPLFMIADLSTVWITADVYEDQLTHVHVGESMKVTTPAYPNEEFIARVDQIGSTIDPDKHTAAVRCVVPNPERRLKPGMFASVILRAAVTQEVPMVSSSAVVTEGDRRSVFVEEAPGRYVKRTVETGNEVGGATIIRSGLKEGERVVVRGGLLLTAAQTA
jgi:membrane fusion protein, heavy metal efflux system